VLQEALSFNAKPEGSPTAMGGDGDPFALCAPGEAGRGGGELNPCTHGNAQREWSLGSHGRWKRPCLQTNPRCDQPMPFQLNTIYRAMLDSATAGCSHSHRRRVHPETPTKATIGTEYISVKLD
jgi:hypothetical protein